MADEEQEDFSAFNSADCAGAVLMLGIVPAVMNYIFFRENMGVTIMLGAGAVGLAAFVFLLSFFTGWRIVGTLVNLAGCILVPVYIAAAVWLWTSPYAPTYKGDIEAAAAEAEQGAPTQGTASPPAPAPAP